MISSCPWGNGVGIVNCKIHPTKLIDFDNKEMSSESPGQKKKKSINEKISWHLISQSKKQCGVTETQAKCHMNNFKVMFDFENMMT